MDVKASLQQVFRSAFTRLSWWKRGLLRLALGLAAVGIAGQAFALLSEGAAPAAGTWSWSALGSGLGCLAGFLVGAAFRVFLKLGLLFAVGVALVVLLLSTTGWVELPWDSLSETFSAFRRFVSEQTASVREALTGYLPSSTMTGAGLFAGVTQKPSAESRAAPRTREGSEPDA